MRKIVIPALLALMMLTGCSSGNVQDRLFLRAVKIDGTSYEFAFFSEDEGVLGITADSPDAALNRAENVLGKRIFTGHTELAVLGECSRVDTLCLLLNDWKVSPSCLAVYDTEADLALAEQLIDSIRLSAAKGDIPECDVVSELSRR